MPTDKRQRQREGREARRAEARAAQVRAARRRQIISAVVLIGGVVLIAFLINRTGSSDSPSPAASAMTTTTSQTSTTTAAGGEPAPCPPAEGAPDKRTAFPAPPPMCIDKAATYAANVETDVGSFTIDLDAAKAPLTVNNFVYLARYRAYEGVPFHRVIPEFVVQGGDVESGTGTGGPGYAVPDELPKEGEYKVGSVAMANSGANTNGSQFFVVTGPQGAGLPAKYSLFGTVNKGMEVVKAIEKDGTAAGTPTVTHKITKVTITEKKG